MFAQWINKMYIAPSCCCIALCMIVLVTVIVTAQLPSGPRRAYDFHAEQELRTDLLTDYESEQRPAEVVNVEVGLTVLTVNNLDIKDQTLTLSAYFTLDWTDSRLNWINKSSTVYNYTALTYIFTSSDKLWKPAVIIQNAVDDVSVLSDSSVPLRIISDGHVIWGPAGVFKVSCESNTRFYPMDTQTCYITVTAWQYTTSELRLSLSTRQAVDVTAYTANGEWSLIHVIALDEFDQKSNANFYSTVRFSIKLQRRVLFHVIKTLIPLSLMSFLIAFAFKLPADSGEKIGFSLTVLLAYAVYLTMISDSIPSTSVTVCFLSVYLAFVLLMATVAVCCSTFVINIYMRTDDVKISEGWKNFTLKYLYKIACVKSTCFCNKNRIHDEFCSTSKVQNINQSLVSVYTTENSDGYNFQNLTWRKLSRITDKVFFNIYISVIIIATSLLFALLIYGYVIG